MSQYPDPGQQQNPSSDVPPYPPPPAAFAGGPPPGEPSAEERLWAGLAHILTLLGFVIPFASILAPVLIYVMKKDQFGPFFQRHCLQSIGFQIGLMVLAIITVILSFVCIGFLLIPVLLILAIVMPILAYGKASKGEEYTYPIIGAYVPEKI